MDKKKQNKLYGYLFHFNHIREEWAAIPRDKQKEYFNNVNDRINHGILFAKDISTLMKFLNK